MLDLSQIASDELVAGSSLALCRLGTAVEGELANLQVSGLSDTLLRRSSLSLADDGTLLLTLARPAKDEGLAARLNRNQSRVYDVLCSLAESGAADGVLAEIADAAATQRELTALQALLDSVSCPELAGMMSSQIEGNLSHLRRVRAGMGRGSVLTADKSSGPAAYVQTFNSDHDVDADASGGGYHRSEWGAMFGMEVQPTEEVTIGFAVEESRAKISPTGAARYHEERTALDLYAAYRVGAFIGNTTIGLGMHDYSMRSGQRNGKDRDIAGFSFNFSQELAYTVALGERMSLQPFFCFDSSVNKVDPFCAGNSGSAALMVDGQRAWATELTLGLRYNAQFAVVSSAPSASFSAQIGAVCSVGDTTDDLHVRFAGAPDKGFDISSADRRRHGFSVGMNLTVPVSESTAVFGSFETVQRGDSDSYDAQLGVRVAF